MTCGVRLRVWPAGSVLALCGFTIGVWATGRMSTPDNPDPGSATWTSSWACG